MRKPNRRRGLAVLIPLSAVAGLLLLPSIANASPWGQGTTIAPPANALAAAPEAASEAIYTTEAIPTGATTEEVWGLVYPAGQAVEYRFNYGVASSQWCKSYVGSPEHSTTPQTTPTGAEHYDVSVSLSGLTAGSGYCVEISTQITTGGLSGGKLIFTAGAPGVYTTEVLSTGATTEEVSGTVDPAGQTTEYHVDYGLASSQWCTSFGGEGSPEHSTSPQTLGFTDGTYHEVLVSLSGLSAGSRYCAAPVASNGSGSTSGGQVPFTAGTHTLTVSLAGSGSVAGTGISCPSTCSASYATGTMVTLTATPAAGSTFSGWSGGGCSGTGTCTATMSSDQAVSATFAASSGGSSPGGGGSNTPSTSSTTATTTPATTAATGSVSLAGSTITVASSGAAAVKLACTGTATCGGKLTLTAKTKGKGKKKAKLETIGTGTFSIQAGKTTTVKLTLNAAGKALLSAAHGHLSATLTILKSSPSPSNTQTQSVHLAQQKAAKGNKGKKK